MPLPSRVAVLLLAGLVLGAGGCADDGTSPDTPAETTAGPTERSPNPHDDELHAAARSLRDTVARARQLMQEAAADAGAAAEAVAVLTADDRLAEADTDATPLFPGPLTSREETIDYGDALTRTLTAARQAGGPLGDRISQMLSDPVAGDLGIWQRDAQGMLDAIDEAARITSLDEAEAAVLELPGEGTRALAYALLAARAPDDESRAAYAERATAHLDIVLRAIDEALDSAGAGDA